MKDVHAHAGTEKITAGTHSPFWVESVEPLAFRKLDGNISVDVVIIGGGMAGITVAYCLARAGKKVAVVEDGFVGSGETGRTTAHLVTALDDRYYDLERLYGEKKMRLIAESHKDAIDFIERTVQDEKIDCDFRRVSGYLFLHPSDEPASLVKELKASQSAGLDVEKLEAIPGMDNYMGPCLKFGSQAQFHPLKYLRALCHIVEQKGGAIYTGTRAKDISKIGITTDKGFKIRAKHVVIATNSPIKSRATMYLKQNAYRTYVIAAKVAKGSLPSCLWWDTGNFSVNKDVPPYHYVRTQPFDTLHDLLIVGGGDHPVGQADAGGNKPEEERFAMLETWARQYFDMNEIVYAWSGQVMEPVDKLAYIGRNPGSSKNVYVVSGDSGNGMTHATIAGTLINDLIYNRRNRFSEIYDPSRFMIKAGSTFIREFFGGLINYFKGKKKTGAEEALHTISRNEGRVVEIDGKKQGVFCDENNQLHFVAAECTHLGCIVKWNNGEKSWDCPCHGSRFTFEGKVINGPANKDLAYHREIRPGNTSGH